MPDLKISELPAITTLADADALPLVQAGVTSRMTAAQLKAYVNTFSREELTANRTYHFAKPEYARAQQDVLKVVFQELQKTNQWAQANPGAKFPPASGATKTPAKATKKVAKGAKKAARKVVKKPLKNVAKKAAEKA